MLWLTLTPGFAAFLLLNMEGVSTFLQAWFVSRGKFDRRIYIGMVLIVMNGGVLSWGQCPEFRVPRGAIAVVGA